MTTTQRKAASLANATQSSDHAKSYARALPATAAPHSLLSPSPLVLYSPRRIRVGNDE
jgi:hypothetical protein